MRGAARRFGPVLLLLAVELVWCVYLAVTRAMPAGHDGFQYFYLKFYVFNDFVENGEAVQWLPFVAHGEPSTWWSMLQGGIFDPIALGLARVLALRDFFPIFYALLFAEKALLVIGTWLLASEHFRTRVAVFAVTAAIAGTAIWYTQPWWNFHAFVALPMMLFFVHRTLTAFRWPWPIALMLLLYLQTFGQPIYVFPMTLLFLALYGGVVIALRDPAPAWRRPSFSVVGMLGVVLAAGVFVVELLWLSQSKTQMSFGGYERLPDGTVALSTFLNYAGYTDLRTWNQFFTGLTPHLDFSVFAGFLSAALLVLTFCMGPLTRAQRLFAWMAALSVLVVTASPLDTLLYYYWPLTGIFRHLALIAPVAKCFVILLAGATLDRLASPRDQSPVPWRAAALQIGMSALWLGLLAGFAWRHETLSPYLAAMTTGELPVLDAYGVARIGARLSTAIVLLAVTMVIVTVLVRRVATRRPTTALAWAAAGVLLLDVTIYGAREMRLRTIPLQPEEAALFRFTPLPYDPARLETPDDSHNVRMAAFADVLKQMVGVRYWTENLIWLADTYRSGRRGVYWAPALDPLFNAIAPDGNPIPEVAFAPHESGASPLATAEHTLKARLLGRAMICPDVASSSRVMTSAAFRGQVAVLIAAASDARVAAALSGLSTDPCDMTALDPASGAHQPGSIRAASFTSNRVEFDVDNPSVTPMVLTYRDAWSDSWEARVGDRAVPVLRADLAYKAVVVPPGASHVAFEYRDPLARAVWIMQAAGAVALSAFLAGMLIQRARRRPADRELTHPRG